MNLAIVGYGKMGRLIERLAPEYGFDAKLRLDVDNNANFEGLTAANFRGIDAAVEFSTPSTAPENIERQILPKRSNQRRTASRKHLSTSFCRHSSSFTISRKSKKPFLPTTHLAARRAPRANPSRLRAVCRIVIVSEAESKPIS